MDLTIGIRREIKSRNPYLKEEKISEKKKSSSVSEQDREKRTIEKKHLLW